MKRKNHFFTAEEDKVIIKNLKKFPLNLRSSFKKSALELNLISDGRDWWSMISGRYYMYLRKRITCVSTGSYKGFSSNIKNQKLITKPQQQRLNEYSFLIQKVMSLPRRKKNELIEILSRER